MALAVGSQGEIWVTEPDQLEELSQQGAFLTTFGTPGTSVGEFNFEETSGVAVAANGSIWVADRGNNRVEEWAVPTAGPSNTSPPTITGEATAGSKLTASEGTWTGAPLRYDHQWQSCNRSGGECVDIAGADSESYTPDNGDVGVTLRVLVSASNAGGSASSASSPTTTVAGATPLSNTTAPAISGTLQDGQTLHASTGSWSGTPASSYTYQWESCDETGGECASIEGATGSEYALGEGDTATSLRVVVTASNDAGPVPATSPATATVAPEPPGEREAPSIAGVPDSHQVLHANSGIWTGSQRQFSYQWESCGPTGGECAPIEGATEPEYDLAEGDIGTTVRVRIGVTSALAALTDVSAATPVIGAPGALASSAPPVVSGTAQTGQTLTVSVGSWSSAGAGYSFQWLRCDRFGGNCLSIEGATAATYTPSLADAGATLRANVTASLERQLLSRVSQATQPVAAAGAPIAEQIPLVGGTPLQGRTLTATSGQWSGEAPIGYSFQWERCTEAEECAAIEGATTAAYTLTERDVGSTVRVLVTATYNTGTSIATSSSTATINPESLSRFSPPTIAGTVEAGQELAAEPGIWSGAGPVSYSYQWESCNAEGDGCAPINGATQPGYLLSEGNLGSTLRATVTATGALGSQSAHSATTVATPGGELTAEQAEETAQQTDPAILAPSTTATLDGQQISPTLEDEEELYSHNVLTSSSISSENPGEFSVNTPDGELSLDPLETSPKATSPPMIVNDTVALYANTSPATDTIVRPDALGATTLLQLRSALAPKSFAWEVQLGAGQQLRQLSDGSVAVVSAEETVGEGRTNAEPEATTPELPENAPETPAEQSQREHEEAESGVEATEPPPPPVPHSSTPSEDAPSGLLQPQNTQAQYEQDTSALAGAETQTDGTTLMVITPPQPVDAHGHAVPSSLHIAGDTVTLDVEPSETTAFPVYAAISVAAPSNEESAERDPFEYGLADEEPTTFAKENPVTHENAKTAENVSRLRNSLSPLDIRTARITIAWDTLQPSESGELKRLEEWLANVEAEHLKPYITLKTDFIHGPPSVHAYRQAIRNLIKTFGSRVKKWGAWNEPDLSENSVRPEQAGHYWQAAESVAVELHCGCKIVAGEFSHYEYSSEQSRIYTSKYKHGLTNYFRESWETKKNQFDFRAWQSHKRPPIWGFHDYADVVAKRTTNASEFQEFANGGKLGRPRIWIGEAGVLLHTGGEPGAATSLVKANDESYEDQQQTSAAYVFLDLRYARPHPLREDFSRIERVYYYQYEAPSEPVVEKKPNEFDSGLVEAEPGPYGKSRGEPRPAYCVLAYSIHECPPTIETLPAHGELEARVDTHGLSTDIEMPYSTPAGSETFTQTGVGEGVLKPFVVKFQLKQSCAPGFYSYQAVAHNSDGNVAGALITEEHGRCIGS